ncbi:hypothetical protein EF514_03870 [Anaerosphaera multitolerans]|uniref:Uncharacterized protein n=1 Tax=Anaerosphaera multitolerans TaxID=2487351 RepID=A0A437S884_9FIRM|nr:hypothetical protein EF514_03870 [Anaerosphaera multitolerans]
MKLNHIFFANWFLFTMIFREIRQALVYKYLPSILSILRNSYNIKMMILELVEYILFPTIIYFIYVLIRGNGKN